MIGKKLGKWTVEKELGRGGMGQVYLARDEFGIQAAVKVLSPDLAQDPAFHQRFKREIDALSQLEHPNIVRFYESGHEDRTFFYVMEYVEGSDFDKLLEEKGRLPWRDVLDAALQICPALKHAHDRGVIHRDLKPQNLLRSATGAVKLTDFGIAKVFAGVNLTSTGGIVGTAEYLSPEQAAGKPVTKRSDLYSLGAVLYHLLTGNPPFVASTVMALLHKHRYGQFDAPRRVVPDVPLELDAVICQLLEKEPADRPADGLVLQRQLEQIRRKLERKAHQTDSNLGTARTLAESDVEPEEPDEAEADPDRAGPATLMSRLMRAELTRQKKGGPVAQWLNQPVVLVPLFLLTVGAIVWGFTRGGDRRTPEELLETATTLVTSEDKETRERGRTEYLDLLRRKHPEFERDQVDHLYNLLDDDRALRRALDGVKGAARMSEAQRFYRRGLALCRQGDAEAARAVWSDLVKSFTGVEPEQRWVELAKKGMDELNRRLPAAARADDSVKAALARARQLSRDNKKAEAETIWQGLEQLYKDDPAAKDVLDQIRKDRG
jgi:predicted Ser/Thr protein kinase